MMKSHNTSTLVFPIYDQHSIHEYFSYKASQTSVVSIFVKSNLKYHSCICKLSDGVSATLVRLSLIASLMRGLVMYEFRHIANQVLF